MSFSHQVGFPLAFPWTNDWIKRSVAIRPMLVGAFLLKTDTCWNHHPNHQTTGQIPSQAKIELSFYLLSISAFASIMSWCKQQSSRPLLTTRFLAVQRPMIAKHIISFEYRISAVGPKAKRRSNTKGTEKGKGLHAFCDDFRTKIAGFVLQWLAAF